MRKKIAQAILKNLFGQHVVDLVWFDIDQGPNSESCFGSIPVDPMHALEEGIVPNNLHEILDILLDAAKSNLDANALTIVSPNCWSPEYPRMNFVGGFSSPTQLTLDAKVGKLLMLLIVVQTLPGKEILGKRSISSFDDQNSTIAARFTFYIQNEYDSSENEEKDDHAINSVCNKYIARPSIYNQHFKKCCQGGGGEEPYHYTLLNNRIDEWPSMFNCNM